MDMTMASLIPTQAWELADGNQRTLQISFAPIKQLGCSQFILLGYLSPAPAALNTGDQFHTEQLIKEQGRKIVTLVNVLAHFKKRP